MVLVLLGPRAPRARCTGHFEVTPTLKVCFLCGAIVVLSESLDYLILLYRYSVEKRPIGSDPASGEIRGRRSIHLMCPDRKVPFLMIPGTQEHKPCRHTVCMPRWIEDNTRLFCWTPGALEHVLLIGVFCPARQKVYGRW